MKGINSQAYRPPRALAYPRLFLAEGYELRKYLQSAETVQKEVWTEVKEQISRNNSITEEWRDVPLDKTPR